VGQPEPKDFVTFFAAFCASLSLFCCAVLWLSFLGLAPLAAAGLGLAGAAGVWAFALIGGD
jgi:hypothetical protein